MAKAKRPIAEVLMESGVDGITAQDIERVVLSFDLTDDPTDEQLAAMEGDFDPDAAIRDARAAWWSGEHIPFEFKRLLDAKSDPIPEEQRGAITVNMLEQWDANLGRFIAKGFLLSPAALNTLERYYDHAKAIDSGPPRPEFSTIENVAEFYSANYKSHDSCIAIQLVWSYLNACDEAETAKAAERDISHVLRGPDGRWINTPLAGDDAPPAQSFTLSKEEIQLLTPGELVEYGGKEIARLGESADILPHYMDWLSYGSSRRWEHISETSGDEFARLLKGHGINTFARYADWIAEHDMVENTQIPTYLLRNHMDIFGEQGIDDVKGFMETTGAGLYWVPSEMLGDVLKGRTAEEAYSLMTGPGDKGELNFKRKLGGMYIEEVLDAIESPDTAMQIHMALEENVLGEFARPHEKLEEGWKHFQTTGIDGETGELKNVDLDADANAYEAVKPNEANPSSIRKIKKNEVVKSLLDNPIDVSVHDVEMDDTYAKLTTEYKGVNKMIGTWAKTSNDNDMRALGLQETAADHFGIPLGEWQSEKIEEVRQLAVEEPAFLEGSDMMGQKFDKGRYLFQDPESAPFAAGPVETARKEIKHYLEKMYTNTQNYFKARGIKTVRLYRGTTTDDRNPGVNPGDVVELADNALSSWSVDWDTAMSFSQRSGGGYKKYGAMVSTVVPVDRILSTAHTGFGCLNEGEAVVLASDGPTYARVESVNNLPSQDLWEQIQAKKASKE